MAWTQKPVAQAGEYLLARTASGISTDIFGSVSNLELLQRLQNHANGWTPVSVRLQRDLFSASITVLAQANGPLDMAAFAADVENAINSFWTMALVRVSVWASPTADAPAPPDSTDETASSIRWLAIGAIAIAAAIVVVQIRKGIS